MKYTILAVMTLMSGLSLAADESPYAGEERRSIKSMSSAEVESLLSGAGMGFAKLAELNHYPGPKHVLELVDNLGLSPSQVSETEALFKEMRSSAVLLGEELIEGEMALDREFSQGAITPESLESSLLNLGKIRAQLRFVHLEAHLRQKRLLSAEQIAKYDETRGYRGAAHDHSEHPKDHN
ncbi:MAG: hypothetical protein AB8G17_05145 [Gammaproteobacteria bacterium]